MFKSVNVSVSTVNEALAQSVINVSKTCSAVANNRINIRAGTVNGNVYIGGSVNQAADAELKCDQASDVQSSLKSETLNTIKASAQATDMSWITGDFGLFSQTSANIKSFNKTVLKSDLTDAMECYNVANNDYNLEYGTITGDFTFVADIDQSSKGKIQECLQKAGISNNLTNLIKNDLDASASAKGTLVSLADSMGDIMIVAIVAGILGVIGVAALKIYKSAPKKGSPDASAISASANPTISAPANPAAGLTF